jgi:hypothetical protein
MGNGSCRWICVNGDLADWRVFGRGGYVRVVRSSNRLAIKPSKEMAVSILQITSARIAAVPGDI